MRLRRPLPLTAAVMAPVQSGYTLSETGAFVLLALAWWPRGQFPRSAWAARALLRTNHYTAKRALEQFRPMFEAGGHMALLRGAHIAKAARRGKAAREATKARMAKRGRDGSGPGVGT